MCWNDPTLDRFGFFKNIFLNMATEKYEVTSVTHIILLLDNTALGLSGLVAIIQKTFKSQLCSPAKWCLLAVQS